MTMEAQKGPLTPAVPAVLPVIDVKRENAGAVTVWLSLEELGDQPGLDLGAFVPGQFFMVWIPRMNEKPYAVAYLDEDRIGITVQKRGPFSTRMCEMKPGEPVGIRGPYGRGYWAVEEHSPGEDVVILGGGCGMAVLAHLAERLPEATVVQGARRAEALFFRDRFPDQVLFTDDGSAGSRGFPTEWLRERVDAGKVKAVYSCGPEQMMLRLVEICREAGVPGQMSLERYMKCGIGVCGQCDCDGRRVCVEGPTFSLEELAEMPSFGHRRRDKTGRAVRTGPADACPSGPTVV